MANISSPLAVSRCATRPFSAACPSGRSTRRLSVLCKVNTDQNQQLSRRTAALFLSGLGLSLISTRAAKALIPDDDDEELVDLAKSRRKERLAEDKKVGKSFVKEGEYNGTTLSKIQNAVNRLAKEGLSLETGDLKSLANSSSESWVRDLRSAIGEVSKNASSQTSSKKVLADLDDLGQKFAGSDLEQAKESFENAVSDLASWISDAGLSSKIKGL